jgi:hypothetical protein
LSPDFHDLGSELPAVSAQTISAEVVLATTRAEKCQFCFDNSWEARCDVRSAQADPVIAKTD